MRCRDSRRWDGGRPWQRSHEGMYANIVDNAFVSPVLFVDGFESEDIFGWSSAFPEQ